MITKTLPALPVLAPPPVLLRTKLMPPVSPGPILKRERLTAALDQGSGARLTLVSAPAGAGKTVLLTEWFVCSQTPAVWLTLDRGDNDLLRFFSYLTAALDGLPAAGGDFSAMLPLLSDGAYEPFLAAVINLLTERKEPAVLVLDDYQAVLTQGIHEGVGFLLEHLPPSLRVVIATREEPPLPLNRLRAGGRLFEIRGDDLRFRSSEARELVRAVLDHELPDRDLAALEAATDGWAAGLQMALVSLRSRAAQAGQADAFAALSERQNQVMEYLSAEVLACQPERVRSFLIQSALFERINAGLCEAVFFDSIFPPGEARETSATAMLEYCQKNNLFLQPAEPGWFRFQKFFRDLLRAHLDEIPLERQKELYRRAAGCCERAGWLAEAVGYALSADLELAARLIERNLDGLLLRCEFSTLLELVSAFPPPWLRERPALAVCKAWAVSYLARKEDVGTLLETIEAGLDQPKDVKPAASLAGYAAAIRARQAETAGDHAFAQKYSLLAIECISSSSALRPVILFFLGESTLYAGDLKGARKYLREVSSLGKVSGNPAIAVSALCRLAKVCKLEGRLREAEELYREASETLGEGGAQRIPFLTGMIEVGQADLYREWDRPDEARRLLEGVVADGSPNPNVLAFGLLTAAELLGLRGKEEAAGGLLRRAQRVAERHHLFFDIHSQLEGAWLRRWLAAGEDRQAAEWMDEKAESIRGEQENAFAASLDGLNRARGCLALGRFDEALALLSNLRSIPQWARMDGLRIEAALLEALTCQAQGRHSQALQALNEALDLGEKQGFRRVYLEKGPPLAALLRLGLKRGTWDADSLAARLLAGMEAQPPEKPAGGASTRGPLREGLAEPLTDREIEILRLMADGFSNAEIAAQLVLSVGTVKAHLHHIFGKLAADGRVKAVQRGRELGLI